MWTPITSSRMPFVLDQIRKPQSVHDSAAVKGPDAGWQDALPKLYRDDAAYLATLTGD